MKYLIMRCDELTDGWECDANRMPITMVDDWEKWYEENNPKYDFEVYSFDGKEFELVKEYDVPVEGGMALYYWVENEEFSYVPHVVKKWPNRTRFEAIPDEVLSWDEAKRFNSDWSTFNLEKEQNYLKGCGIFAWNATVKEEDRNYTYGEYRDGKYSCKWW